MTPYKFNVGRRKLYEPFLDCGAHSANVLSLALLAYYVEGLTGELLAQKLFKRLKLFHSVRVDAELVFKLLDVFG